MQVVTSIFARNYVRQTIGSLGTLAAVAAIAAPAAAHHPTGGRMPATLLDGLLSGIGHPVIGPDHLAFIIAIGIAAALLHSAYALIAAFVSATTAGVILRTVILEIPLAETVVALSVVAAGALVAAGPAGKVRVWLPLAAVAGLFHGLAFGEAIIGAERGVVGAYLIGIAIIASVIALGVMRATPTLLALATGSTVRTRAAGAVVGCVGLAMVASSLGSG